jgi:SAM-dependent methyltransferase
VPDAEVATVACDQSRLLRDRWDRRWLGGLYEGAPPLAEVRDFVDTYLCQLGQGDLIIDLGCGNGRHLRTMASTTTMVGTDVSRHALRALALALQLEGLSAPTLQCMHATLPFARHSFAGGLAVQSIQDGTLETSRDALRELWRVLRPGAPVFLRVPRSHDPIPWAHQETGEEGTVHYIEGPKAGLCVHHFEEADLREVITTSGFDVVEGPFETDAPRIPPLVGRARYLNAVLVAQPLRAIGTSPDGQPRSSPGD